MVGNDIVDINEAKRVSDWERPRFLSKLFTAQEQEGICNSKQPFLRVWHLWTMKEAAYKLYAQLHQVRFYNPKAFKCEVHGLTGDVSYGGFTCYVQTRITSDYLLSEARLTQKKIQSKVVTLTRGNHHSQSKELKYKLLSDQDVIDSADLKTQIISNALGIPFLQSGNKCRAISLTHHGLFGAYVIA